MEQFEQWPNGVNPDAEKQWEEENAPAPANKIAGAGFLRPKEKPASASRLTRKPVFCCENRL